MATARKPRRVALACVALTLGALMLFAAVSAWSDDAPGSRSPTPVAEVAPDQAPDTGAARAAHDDARSPVARQPSPAARPELRGVVRTPDGCPVAGAAVDLWFGVQDSWREPLASLRTDDAGRFACDAGALLAVASPQRAALRVEVDVLAERHLRGRERLDVAEALEPIELVIVGLDGEGSLAGVVRDRRGSPVAGAIVCRADPPQEEYAVADERGRYAVEFTPEFAGGIGVETLFAFHPALGVSRPVDLRLPGKDESAHLDFVITEQDAVVEGITRGGDGRPLPGVHLRATLEAAAASQPGPRYRTGATVDFRSDADGRFALRGHLHGDWSLGWTYYGEGAFFVADVDRAPLTVAPGQGPVVVDVDAVAVDFDVRDADGRAVRDVAIAGTITPPPDLGEATEFALDRTRRLWLPPGCRVAWRLTGDEVAEERGEVRTHGGRALVEVVVRAR